MSHDTARICQALRAHRRSHTSCTCGAWTPDPENQLHLWDQHERHLAAALFDLLNGETA